MARNFSPRLPPPPLLLRAGASASSCLGLELRRALMSLPAGVRGAAPAAQECEQTDKPMVAGLDSVLPLPATVLPDDRQVCRTGGARDLQRGLAG
jgi:hypothetical protein